MSGNIAVELKGSMYTFLSLKLHSSDANAVSKALADKVQQAPGFFADTPIVVDLTPIEKKADIDVALLLNTIREHKLVPVIASVLNKERSLSSDQIKAIGIPLVEAGTQKKTDEKKNGESSQSATTAATEAATAGTETIQAHSDLPPEDNRAAATAESPANPATRSLDPIDLAMAGTEVQYIVKSPKLVTRPVRSGQQIYARETDLVVLGQIGPGAEIIADNNIHVYGPLRGRALCGVAGNTEARIFCQSLEAELVSVAGNYKLLEEIPEELRGKPAQISFDKNKLVIEPL